MKTPGIMFDLETLSNNYDAVIVSIGACKFSFEKGILDTFYVNIDPKDSKSYGLTIDQSTIDWWMTQPKEARDAWKKDPKPLKEAMTSMIDWWSKDSMVYCNGAAFDLPILYSNLKVCGLNKPWQFRNEMDLRTIYRILGIDNHKLRAADASVQHNALDDAIEQTKHLLKAFSE
jgi:DNA polymerase III epsilon subunit-like protein